MSSSEFHVGLGVQVFRASLSYAHHACLRDSTRTRRVRDASRYSLLSYLILPDGVKLLLRRLGVGIVARFDIIVLRGQAEIIFRRSGRCPLLIARRDGRLDPVETGLKTHSKQLALNGPVSSRHRANYIAKLITSFRFILCHYFQTDYSYSSRDSSKSRDFLRASEKRSVKGNRERQRGREREREREKGS